MEISTIEQVILSKSRMSSRESDRIANLVRLRNLMFFIKHLAPLDHSARWKGTDQENSWKGGVRIWRGELWWAICIYLSSKKLIAVDGSYDNTMEHLYQKVIDRLVESGMLFPDKEKEKYYTWN